DEMDWLKRHIFDGEEFGGIGKGLGEAARVLVKNAPGSLPVLIADYLSERCARPVLFVAETTEDAEEAVDDLTVLMEYPPLPPHKVEGRQEVPPPAPPQSGGETRSTPPGSPAKRRGESSPCFLPERPHFARELTPVEQSERAEVLLTLAGGGQSVVVTTAAALLDPVPEPGSLSANLYTITKGETLPRESLLQYLVEAGYKREMFAESVGQFAVRGAVVDIYPFGAAEPMRLEFFGEEVESLRTFDPSSQKSTGYVDDVTMVAAELPNTATSSLLAHLPANAVIVWASGRPAWGALKKSYEERQAANGNGAFRKLAERFVETLDLEDEASEEPEEEIGEDENDTETASNQVFLNPEEIRRASRSFTQIFLESAPWECDSTLDLQAQPQERFAANLPLVADRLKEYHEQGTRAVLLCDTDAAGERLAQILIERGCPDNAFVVREGGLHHGFTLTRTKLAVLVDHDIFGRMRRRRRFLKFKNVVPLHDIDALKPGDFVVHVDYGIGRYMGLTKISVGGTQREVLKIEYRDGVTLFVKLENLAQVQKYSGRDGFQPPLSKIGGRDWRDLKRKTKKSLLSIAEELIKLYAQRKSATGIAYSDDTAWQREMEASFAYEDTLDQMRAAEDVKHDMERPLPMDRLICGDVGYGKTEIAIRAAFKSVTDGKQVAVLVPTTILAQQHFRTFRERLKNWPIRVEVLSRFQSAKEQKQTLKRLADGKADILIGTHRLLSKDVQFSDLGLLIIDEEHRFGVVQKERIKSLRANIDVLAMSATPIPRTLHMALMGARDLSQINTPPPGRLPIETDVVQFSEKVIKDSITYEMQRGGQVFFVHNRIESIEAVRRMLMRLLPKVRFAVAHGKMDEDKLSHVMVDFIEGSYDVLISTMIIESGLDLPNVNTMIVNRADRFGVAQLHQLRGRIGRSSRKAYAYLLVPHKFEISRMARQRLAALTNFSSLGAGFQVAMRDLEIRGAGNLLGREQSGYINAVGFEMYQKLIEEAVREVKLEVAGGNGKEQPPVELRLKLEADAFFPEDYMPEGAMRLNYYRDLSRTKELDSVDEAEREVADRFGRLPDAARNLFDMVRVRILREWLGAETIALERAVCTIEFPQDGLSRERVLGIAAAGEGFPVEFSASGPLKIRLPLGMVKDWREKLGYTLKYLHKIAEVGRLQAADTA
ncbi:transcription-repair coupling factor, partial [bacterium]|nr:transcription-repair coupling factor [bacterium]MBU1982906.1 transcription-repair coupling factor [bacterium]